MPIGSWPFPDPRSAAVFVDRRVLSGDDWISYVSHDLEDGAWQFHGHDGFCSVENANVVSLQSIYMLDETVGLLADLPAGWHAWRETPAAPWMRRNKSVDH